MTAQRLPRLSPAALESQRRDREPRQSNGLDADACREVLRQLDRDLDARYGCDRLRDNSLYPVNEPTAFWLHMEGKTECPECGSVLNITRLCPAGCLDELELRMLGVAEDRGGLLIGERDRRGWVRK